MKFIAFFSLSFFGFFQCIIAQDTLSYSKTEIIYGRKDGMALTMIMLVPKNNTNGKGIINVVSGNWVSNYNNAIGYINRSKIYLDNGYTVFASCPSRKCLYTNFMAMDKN